MIRKLPPDLAKIAKEELNENSSRTEDDIKHLKEWILKQPHLKARTDDQWLVAMLRGCKFSLEKVKQKLDLYYTLRTVAPEVTQRMKPTNPQFLDFFRLGSCLVLPKPKDKLFPRVILIRAGVYDPNTHSVADLMCILYYLVQILLMEDDIASVMGTRIMVDYTGVTLNHLVQATPSMLKKMVAVCQDSMPLRLKGSNHVNLPSGIEKIFTLISGFLNEKAKQRLRIHKNIDDIQKSIPIEIIPNDYGGGGESVANITEYWASKFIEYKTWMEQEDKFGTDESRRPDQLVDRDVMGVDGSFRKLDID